MLSRVRSFLLRLAASPEVSSAVNTDSAGNAYPATAQHAVGEGQHAARNIVATIRGNREIRNIHSLLIVRNGLTGILFNHG